MILFLLIGCGVASIALSYFVRALLNLFLQGGWVLNYWRINIISKPLVDIDVIRNLIKACLYPFLSRLSGVLMSNSHSFLIAFFINPALAALYDITAKVCTVACTFANMTNGSFFALFSLTIASKDKKRIDSVFNTTTRFFMATLTSILLYCICFTEPIVYYWVGLDKFGGTILLVAIVISNVFQQIRLYCNNIIYTGGLINKSAKLDILCMFVYLGLLVVIIRKAELYAIPIALLVSCALFIIWYLRILSKDLRLDLSKLIGTSVVSVAIAIPFFLAHFLLSPNYHYVLQYVVYFILFTVAFFTALYFTNKDLAKQVKVRLLRP